MALRWCLDFEAVSVIIPGAKSPEQAKANIRAGALGPLARIAWPWYVLIGTTITMAVGIAAHAFRPLSSPTTAAAGLLLNNFLTKGGAGVLTLSGDNTFTGAKDSLEGYNEHAERVQFLYSPSATFNALFNVHARSTTGSARLFRANVIKKGSNDFADGYNFNQISTNGQNGQELTTNGANARLTWDLGSVKLFSITGYEGVDNYSSRGDIDGGTLSVSGLTVSAGNGTLVDNLDGTWSYTPALNDDSAVSFAYTVSDGAGIGTRRICCPPSMNSNVLPNPARTSVTRTRGPGSTSR